MITNSVILYHASFSLYKIQYADAIRIPICSTGLSNVSAMSFHPQEGHLWLWDNAEGLFTINIDLIKGNICEKTEIFREIASVEGTSLGIMTERNSMACADTILYQYSYETGTIEKVCDNFPSQVKVLDTLANSLLLFALHKNNEIRLYSFDINYCLIKNSVFLSMETQYTEIERMI